MKSEITKLIDKYNREKGKRYNEDATKKDFILPLFKMIGWDVDNSNEVTPEDNVSRKRVDYTFKIDGIPKFYLEAKPLDENLDGYREQNGIKTTFAQQSVNYAYYKGCIWAILTNFSEIRIYDAWTRDTASGFRFAIRIDNFVNDFDNGLYLLSKEAFKQGELDKKYSTKSRKKPITEQLLSDFTKFRAILSKDVYALNKSKNLTEEELDEAIQRLFDRLIFIRNCEDRGLEPPNLLALLRQWKENRKGTLISKLRELFEQYNEDYDSKIFGEHEGNKHLCDQIDISDNVLSRILDGLYTTENGSIQYDFSLIDADVLGNIYEQYLGHILKKTEKRTKLTESKAKRKEEGIYYTPSYIVDYIVRNTVGELVKSKKTDVSKIKVLDPACGSGSFLIKTFDVLNEYHSKKEGYSQNKLDISGTGTTYSTKLSILTNNIFGVDLDKQAVDIAQLNLLLKVAEKKKRLPILRQNIKNGNSLIDDSNIAGDKAFKWNEEFAEIMSNGGFDVVVGNPPYFNIKPDDILKSSPDFKNLSNGVVNSAALFLKKSMNLLKEGGYLGFIIPKSFAYVDSWKPIRQVIYNEAQLLVIVDVSKAFKDVLLEQVIIIIRKHKPKLLDSVLLISDFNTSTQSIAKIDYKEIVQNDRISFQANTLETVIYNKVNSGSVLLGEISDNFRGIGVQKLISNMNNLGERILSGKEIQRYAINDYHNYFISKDKIPEISKVKNLRKPKIMVQNIVAHIRNHIKITATYDTKGVLDLDTVNNIVINNKDFNPKYILALLNSKLISYYTYIFIYSKAIRTMHFDGSYSGKIPIKRISKEEQEYFNKKVSLLLELNSKYNSENKLTDKTEKLKNEINMLENEIDNQVYKIYGITEEEKKVIEESLT